MSNTVQGKEGIKDSCSCGSYTTKIGVENKTDFASPSCSLCGRRAGMRCGKCGKPFCSKDCHYANWKSKDRCCDTVDAEIGKRMKMAKTARKPKKTKAQKEEKRRLKTVKKQKKADKRRLKEEKRRQKEEKRRQKQQYTSGNGDGDGDGGYEYGEV